MPSDMIKGGYNSIKGDEITDEDLNAFWYKFITREVICDPIYESEYDHRAKSIKISLSSSNENVIKFYNYEGDDVGAWARCMSTAGQAGNATITVTTYDGKYQDSCNIEVYVPLNGISLQEITGELEVGSDESNCITYNSPFNGYEKREYRIIFDPPNATYKLFDLGGNSYTKVEVCDDILSVTPFKDNMNSSYRTFGIDPKGRFTKTNQPYWEDYYYPKDNAVLDSMYQKRCVVYCNISPVDGTSFELLDPDELIFLQGQEIELKDIFKILPENCTRGFEKVRVQYYDEEYFEKNEDGNLIPIKEGISTITAQFYHKSNSNISLTQQKTITILGTQTFSKGFSFKSNNSFNISFKKEFKHDGELWYFTEQGWEEWSSQSTIIPSVKYKDNYYVFIRGVNNTGIYNTFIIDGEHVSCQGDIRTLLDYSNVENTTMVYKDTGCFEYLFYDCTSLTSAPELPAKTLTKNCYESMFEGCTSLTTAPALPATTLAEGCYCCMFDGCTSLTTAPELLPATTLATRCYGYMFSGCTSLTSAPEIFATTLAESCCGYMFYKCTSLVSAPALPATNLANYCYYHMFEKCSSLKNAPALPATTLAEKCYSGMFKGCISLMTVPALLANKPASECCLDMFLDCSSLMFSKTKDDYYKNEFKLPSSWTYITSKCKNMFSGTGGVFIGTLDRYTLWTSNEIIYPEGYEND